MWTQQLVVTLGLIGLAVLVGWRFDWPSIRSRPLAIGLAIVFGLLPVPVSFGFLLGAGMADYAEARAPSWWPLYVAVVPPLVSLAFVALISRRRNRLLVVAVGTATFLVGCAGVLGSWSSHPSSGG